MKTDGQVFGEKSLSKLAAVYDSREAAEAVTVRLRQQFQLAPSQLQLISPGEPRAGRRIEPDSRGIRRTAIKAHITFALLGVASGLVIFAILWGMQLRAVSSSPWAVVGVLVFFGAAFGLFAGGLITLRPDQDHVILKIQSALDQGKHVVVAHPHDHREREALSAALRRTSDAVSGSL